MKLDNAGEFLGGSGGAKVLGRDVEARLKTKTNDTDTGPNKAPDESRPGQQLLRRGLPAAPGMSFLACWKSMYTKFRGVESATHKNASDVNFR